MRSLCVALALTGCGFDELGVDRPTDATSPSESDATPGAPDGPVVADARVDATPSPPDGPAPCPTACSFCHADGTCQIDCGTGECGDGVVCPPGLPCIVNCIGSAACETGLIDCTEALTCDIE